MILQNMQALVKNFPYGRRPLGITNPIAIIATARRQSKSKS
jgi:hypothetical protein